MERVLEKPLDFHSLAPVQVQALHTLIRRGNLDPLLHSRQRELMRQLQAVTEGESEDKLFLVWAARQFGKTHLGLCFAIAFAKKHPGSRVLYYGPTKDKLQSIVSDGLGVIEQFLPHGTLRRVKSDYRWEVDCGPDKPKSEIRILCAERAHVDRNRGLNGHLIVCEEFCFIGSDDARYALETIIRPQTLRFNAPIILITTPALDEEHYVHTDILPRLLEENAVCHYTVYDNPFLTDAKIEAIRKNTTIENWEREYLCKITKAMDLLVIPEFSDRHVSPLVLPEFFNPLISIDLGGVLDPTAINFSYFDHKLKKQCYFDEALVPVNSSLSDVIAASVTLETTHKLYVPPRVVDCSGMVSIELFEKGFQHFLPEKPQGSFEANIQAFRIAAQNDEILVDPRCKNTITQMRTGQYDKTRKDFARRAGANAHHHDFLASSLYAYRHRDESDPAPRRIDPGRLYSVSEIQSLPDSDLQSLLNRMHNS